MLGLIRSTGTPTQRQPNAPLADLVDGGWWLVGVQGLKLLQLLQLRRNGVLRSLRREDDRGRLLCNVASRDVVE